MRAAPVTVGGLVAALLAAPPAAAAPCVEVELGALKRSFSARQVASAADVPRLPFTIRPVAGSPKTINQGGTSVRALILLAGGNPDTRPGVNVFGSGRSVHLRVKDVADPTPFAEGPPIVWCAAGGSEFLRPVRDGADANAEAA